LSRKTKADQRKRQLIFAGKILAAVLIPVILFYLMEFYEHNPFAEVRRMAQLFNIVLFELTAWGLFFLTGSARAALRIETAGAMLFGLVNHYVMAFRSTPFVPWDIFSVRTAASVAGNYDFTPGVRVGVVTALFVLLFVLLQFLHLKWNQKILRRLIPTGISFLALFLFSCLLQNENFQTSNYLYPFLFTPAYMTKVNGMAVTFTMDMAYVKVDRPQGYSAKEAEEILAEYEKKAEAAANGAPGTSGASGTTEATGAPDAAVAGGAAASGDADYPNIIVIMDEAFSDLAVLGEVDASEDYMPFIHELQQGADNTITGYLNVSVCGGNTADTEFEFLTGNTMAFLPTGSIPYQQYITGETPSLASYLRELGYTTYAMHPYNSTGWNRDRVYPWLGFEESYFKKDLSSVSYLRTYVSDRSDFSNLIQLYENKPAGQPLFLFNVTMQNHGSYTTTYDNFMPQITVEGIDSVPLSQYLSLIQKTDEAFRELLAYFEEQPERTVVVFFGDHQPNNAVAGKIASADTEETLRYQVPYVIWANYDIAEASGVDTSANYLAAHVLSAAGVPTSGYQDFLLSLEEKYPIFSAVRKETSQEDEEALLTYQKLAYYLLFDWKGDTQ
jgi:phosphoglycerol transferase MdoB-like AlkP superfamily enzyme